MADDQRARPSADHHHSGDCPAVSHPTGVALRPRGPLLAFRHSQMGWLPPTERYRCAAFQRGIPVAPAGRALLISSARAYGLHGRLRGNRLSGPPRPRTRHATGRVRAASDDPRRRADGSRRLASARDLGGHGARRHGVGAGATLARLLDRVVVWSWHRYSRDADGGDVNRGILATT